MSRPLVRVEATGPVLVVTLDRPDRRNAVSAAMTAGLDAAFERLATDDDLRVAVLAAEGPVFCAGSDLVERPGGSTPRGGEYGFIRRRRTKPVVAAVQGPALGGGFELVLACDLVVASTSAWFSLPEAGRGRVPNAGGLFRAADRLPRNVALELLVAGGRLQAQRAYELGLVNRLVAGGTVDTMDTTDTVLEEAVRLAQGVCGSAPGAVAAVLDAVRAIDDGVSAAGWQATATALERTLGSSERAEGDLAFTERLPPRWAASAP